MHSLVILLIALVGFDHRFGGGEAGTLSVSLEEAASYVVLYLLIVHTLLFRTERAHAGVSKDPAVRAVGAYAIWLGLGAGANAFFLGNLDAFHGLKDSVPGLVLFAALVAWVDSEKKLQHVHLALAAVLVLLGTLALSQFFWGGPYLNRLDPNALFKLDYRGAFLVRHPVVGTLGSPNTNAVFLAPLALVTAGALVESTRASDRAPGRPWLALAVLACGVALAATQAKMAVALGVVGLLLLFVTGRMGYRATPGRAGLVFCGIVALAALSVALLTRYSTSLPETFALGTLVQRAALDQSALNLLRDSASTALLGGGIQEFGNQTGGVLGIHNEYLRQSVQAGIPAGALFTGTLFSGILRRQERWTYLVPLLFLGLIFLTESATGNQLQSMVFLTLGLCVAASRLERERSA